MKQNERIKSIIQENNLKQKDFAASLKITESYVSKLVKDPDINISNQLLDLIEEKYGYNPQWILSGSDPKFNTITKNENLSETHQKLISDIEKMSESELLAVRAFIESLDAIRKSSEHR